MSQKYSKKCIKGPFWKSFSMHSAIFSQTRKPCFHCAGAVGLHVRPPRMTPFFGLFSLHPPIPSQVLSRHNFFMHFLVFGPKMVPERGPRGWTSNVVFGHFGAPGLPWGPPWLPDLAPGPPGPLQILIFGDFRYSSGQQIQVTFQCLRGNLFAVTVCTVCLRAPLLKKSGGDFKNKLTRSLRDANFDFSAGGVLSDTRDGTSQCICSPISHPIPHECNNQARQPHP